MSSIIKVDNIQNQSGANIIKEDSNTITLGASGDTIALASGASQTGFGRTGTVDWNTTPKTATFSAVSGDGFFCNTTGGAFTCNLPAGSAGAIVSLADYAGTWQTNNLTVSPNGTDKIGSVNGDVSLSTEGQSVTFIFVDSTQGWINVQDSTSNVRANPFIIATGGTITTVGNDKIHTFTGPGTFTVCAVGGSASVNKFSHLVVAGGGGAGTMGGGGAGGYREVKNPETPYTASPLDGFPSAPNIVTASATSYPITVGGGGTGQACNPGTSGNNSIFSTIVSAGGGGGNRCGGAGVAGGSGGGAGFGGPGQAGGAGNTPPTTPAQGQDGGKGNTAGYSDARGGGGGGAGAVGADTPGTAGGAGGAGVTSSINNTPTQRAGGGGAGGDSRPGPISPGGRPGGPGGAGGGGAGAGGGSNPGGTAGTVNTGGGGGAAGYGPGTYNTGATGGSGIVIIRYKFQ